MQDDAFNCVIPGDTAHTSKRDMRGTRCTPQQPCPGPQLRFGGYTDHRTLPSRVGATQWRKSFSLAGQRKTERWWPSESITKLRSGEAPTCAAKRLSREDFLLLSFLFFLSSSFAREETAACTHPRFTSQLEPHLNHDRRFLRVCCRQEAGPGLVRPGAYCEDASWRR